MNLLLAIAAGVSGTFVMTLLSKLLAGMIKKPFHVITILATMISFRSATVPEPEESREQHVLPALFIHYIIGAFFGVAYDRLILEQIIPLTLTHALFFGCALGVIAVLGWRIFFSIHPSPPKLNLYQYLLMIFVGHIVLALTMFVIFSQFYKIPMAVLEIPVC